MNGPGLKNAICPFEMFQKITYEFWKAVKQNYLASNVDFGYNTKTAIFSTDQKPKTQSSLFPNSFA